MLEAKAATKDAVVGGPMGKEVCETVMPSDAFSASLTTAEACKRRTILWGRGGGRIAATYAARFSSLVCLAAPATYYVGLAALTAASHGSLVHPLNITYML